MAFTTATPATEHNIAYLGEEGKMVSNPGSGTSFDNLYYISQMTCQYRYYGVMPLPIKAMYTITQADIDSNGSGDGNIYFDICVKDDNNASNGLYFYALGRSGAGNSFAFLLG